MRNSATSRAEVLKNCRFCGDEFTVASNRRLQGYCTDDCRLAAGYERTRKNQPKKTLACKQCRQNFEIPVKEFRMFCGEKCSRDFWNNYWEKSWQ